MPVSIIHIKPCKNITAASDFINSIALSTNTSEENNNTEDIKGDYSILLYKSKNLNKYLSIDYQQNSNAMNITVQNGQNLKVNAPFQSNLDSSIVKQEFQSLLNSNKEWTFRQSFQMRNYSMGFYNDFVKIYKWDIHNDVSDLLGIKLLIEYDTPSNLKDLESVLNDVVRETPQSVNNFDVFYDLKNKTEISLKVLSMVL
ncbi:hypothetical protein HANVADRAFT_70340 [Hanseniaspora valbyensis NRRL Y-1626]|uniref:Uncharacterized protein n=1 Tax=Hanseniaspora valbyensis NRRL Y-1626 TaxID=766949 RepID=A0A1B7TE56_9ASCO|nr:hypothetical protein HANVADRAFT_70340 [Hanseniaspora valbyensis NRRL Y-1626]